MENKLLKDKVALASRAERDFGRDIALVMAKHDAIRSCRGMRVLYRLDQTSKVFAFGQV